MPIKGISDQHRLPRLGKIHLGHKEKAKSGVEYPRADDHFVCPPEVQAVYGEKPKRLDVIIPVEDEEVWASQYYRMYSRSRGLVCKGDGETCRRMIDKDSGAVANKTTTSVKWEEGLDCQGRACLDYQAKRCQEVMNLQVMLPKVPGLGVWQIDTGSINSIRNINDCATMVRAVCDRVSWIPLSLTIEPTEVVNPDDGKKKVVHCLHLRQEKGLLELIDASQKPRQTLLLSMPADDEAPMDKPANINAPEEHDEALAEVADDVDAIFGEANEVSPDVKHILGGLDLVGWQVDTFRAWLNPERHPVFAGLNTSGTSEDIVKRMNLAQIDYTKKAVDQFLERKPRAGAARER